jgi:hypothetical protein
MQIKELLERWQTDEGKPYKGKLIDWSAYEADPDNIMGCMCAQGQVLYLMGGFGPLKLRETTNDQSDFFTSEFLHISRAHAALLRVINDRADGAPAVVLTDPGKVLGDQWSKLLDFWWYLDRMMGRDWKAAEKAAKKAAWSIAWYVAWRAAGDAAGQAAWQAATYAAERAALDAAGEAARVAPLADGAGKVAKKAAARASWEIQGAAILRRDGRPFVFLPAFGFASPDDIPARPAYYGITGR